MTTKNLQSSKAGIACIIVDDDPMSVAVLTKMVQKTGFLDLIQSFNDPVEAATFLAEEEVDLVFLDVEMPGMTGLELLRTLSDPPAVILVSSKKDYALDAFEFNVTDYILKPPSWARFLKAVQKVKDVQQAQEEDVFRGKNIFVKADSVLVKLNIEQILWVEALADYIAIHTDKKRYIAHTTMKSMERKLPGDEFIRVHRSYIVRLDEIDKIEDNTVIIGQKLIPVGGTYRGKLMSRLDLI